LATPATAPAPHLHFHFMDSADLLQANPVPVCLDIEGETYDPPAGTYVSADE